MGSGLWPGPACDILMLEGASPPPRAGSYLLGPSGGSLGLLIFGELLKPGADYGLLVQP